MSFVAKILVALVLAGLLTWLAGVWMRRLIGVERTRAFFGGVILLGISMAVVLPVAEYAARWAFRDIVSTGDNTSYFTLRGRTENPPRVNSAGFRDRDVPMQPPPGRYRIALIGDSFTYGQGVSEEERFGNRVQRQLNREGLNIEILNFGRPGAETVDHAKMLSESALPYRPDYVLLQWYVNDVENGDYSGRPSYRRLVPSDVISGYLHRHSALYYLVNQAWMAVQRSFGWGGVPGYTEYMLARFADPETASSRLADDALADFINRSTEADAGIGIVLFPKLHDDLATDYPLALLHDRVIDKCAEFDIVCLDLRGLFAVHNPIQDLWVNRFDSHPGPLANRIAADAIAERFGAVWRPLAAR